MGRPEEVPSQTSSSEESSIEAASKPARRDWRARLPFFYGWLIVAAAFVSLGLTYTVWYSFAVFYVALLEEFGWSRASSAGVFSLFVIVVGVAGAGAGALADRLGPGRIISVAVTILAVGLVACSRITSLWQFYLFFGVITGIGLSATGWVPCVIMINRWFSVRLGAALGIASSGIGMGILVMVPVSQWLINQLGWRMAYVALAGIVLTGVLPITLLLMRGRPEDLGLPKDGRRTEIEPAPRQNAPTRRSRVVDERWAGTPWTVATALRTRRYWMLFATMALANIATQMIFVHQVAFLVDGGYDKLLAASIVGLVGLFSVGAKIGWGWISDRLGREITWSLGLSATLAAIFLLGMTRYAPSLLLTYLYAMVFALGYGATAPLTPAVSADLFAGSRFGSIYGTLAIANGLGSATGAWFAGYVFDLTGSYLTAFGTGAACSLLSILTMWVIAPRLVRRVPGRC